MKGIVLHDQRCPVIFSRATGVDPVFGPFVGLAMIPGLGCKDGVGVWFVHL